jgi:trehalose 6-phosphate synthase/phosphatase
MCRAICLPLALRAVCCVLRLDHSPCARDVCGTLVLLGAPPGCGCAQAKELIDHLESVMIGEAIEVVSGHLYVEAKPKGLSKGSTVQRLLETLQPDFVLCAGDDKSDEEMFHSFNEHGHADTAIFACTVGQKPSQAHYYVNDNKGVVALLSALVQDSAASTKRAAGGTDAESSA